jgi:hypothetical protein
MCAISTFENNFFSIVRCYRYVNKYFFFQKNIPIITCLCNPGIRQRHWNQMGKVIGFDITPNSGQLFKKVEITTSKLCNGVQNVLLT